MAESRGAVRGLFSAPVLNSYSHALGGDHEAFRGDEDHEEDSEDVLHPDARKADGRRPDVPVASLRATPDP